VFLRHQERDIGGLEIRIFPKIVLSLVGLADFLGEPKRYLGEPKIRKK